MTVQTTYTQLIDAAFAGATSNLAPSRTLSFLNPSAKNQHIVTVASVVNLTLYEITINGIVTGFTSDASATEAEIRSNLRNNINANPLLASLATAESGATSDLININAVFRDVQLIVTVTATILTVAESIVPGLPRPYGLFYGFGAASTSQLGGVNLIPLADVNTVVAGVLRHTHGDATNPYQIPFTNDPAPARDLSGLPAGSEGSIQTQGHIWCLAEEVMVPGDDVFARHTAGSSGSTIGIVRNDSNSATAGQVLGAVAHEHRADLNLVRVGLSLPSF